MAHGQPGYRQASAGRASSARRRCSNRRRPMAQQPIELILTRQLASYLATPMFLVGPAGELLFYNEPAEALLGYRFDEALEIPLDEWAGTYQLFNTSTGEQLTADEFPVVTALRDRRPHHSSLLYQ